VYSYFVFSKCFVQSLFNLFSTIGWSNYKLPFQLSKTQWSTKYSKIGAEFEFWKNLQIMGCAYNIRKHSLGITSLTLTVGMIPVGMSMLIFVHYYHTNNHELSLFCLLSSLMFVHAANQHDIYSSCFSSVSVSFEVNGHQSPIVAFVVSVIK
jgi:hypothetical protein